MKTIERIHTIKKEYIILMILSCISLALPTLTAFCFIVGFGHDNIIVRIIRQLAVALFIENIIITIFFGTLLVVLSDRLGKWLSWVCFMNFFSLTITYAVSAGLGVLLSMFYHSVI